jgi:Zn-dependent protease
MWVSSVILTFVALNVTLCLFNLIPLAPLDGNSVLNGVVTGQMAVWLAPLRTYGPQILLGLLLISFLPGVNILWRVLGPAQAAIMHLLLGS